jgi:hypothetical protein
MEALAAFAVLSQPAGGTGFSCLGAEVIRWAAAVDYGCAHVTGLATIYAARVASGHRYRHLIRGRRPDRGRGCKAFGGAWAAPAPALEPLLRQHRPRQYADIVRANTLNIPNGILLFFGVLTITFGSWRDALFLGILVSNIALGSFQEIRSKRALDRLASLVAPEAVVVRDGVDRRVPVDRVVVGDLVRLKAGDQVVADGTLVSADALALDEANLTGESEPAVRGRGEPVWSGSFAVEGAALFDATAVGPESRAARLAATARAFRHPRSPLERANDRLLLLLLALVIPLTVGLTVSVLTRVETTGARVQGPDRGDREPRPRGPDPADQRHGGGIRLQDGPARRARATPHTAADSSASRPLHGGDRGGDAGQRDPPRRS